MEEENKVEEVVAEETPVEAPTAEAVEEVPAVEEAPAEEVVEAHVEEEPVHDAE